MILFSFIAIANQNENERGFNYIKMTILEQNNITFPHPNTANEHGAVAIGGDLSIDRLMLGYQYGFFPWYNLNEPIIWWHPDPRFVLFTEDIRITKSMRPYFNQEKFKITFDQQFVKVMRSCQKVTRKNQPGTWISEEIISAYTALHNEGVAHSVEVLDQNNKLVGGLYGISLGRIFFGESMFSKSNNASKFALISLASILRKNGFHIIDCQMPNPHLKKMGGRYISRNAFMAYLRDNVLQETIKGDWNFMLNNVSVSSIING